MSRATIKKNYIIIKRDERNLNYEKYFDTGKSFKIEQAYRSGSEEKINIKEIIKILSKEPIIKKYLS